MGQICGSFGHPAQKMQTNLQLQGATPFWPPPGLCPLDARRGLRPIPPLWARAPRSPWDPIKPCAVVPPCALRRHFNKRILLLLLLLLVLNWSLKQPWHLPAWTDITPAHSSVNSANADIAIADNNASRLRHPDVTQRTSAAIRLLSPTKYGLINAAILKMYHFDIEICEL